MLINSYNNKYKMDIIPLFRAIIIICKSKIVRFKVHNFSRIHIPWTSDLARFLRTLTSPYK